MEEFEKLWKNGQRNEKYDFYRGSPVSTKSQCIFQFVLLKVKTNFSGETEANKERRLQGQIDTKLNEVGEKQATLAGKVLKDVKFDVAYSSDLQRAKKTCQLILEQNGPSNVGDIQEDPRIKERSFGDYENQPVNEFENKAKEAGFSRWIDYVPENGESRDDVRNRAKNFINVSSLKWVLLFH